MQSSKVTFALLAVLTIVSAVQHAWYWSQLPERVATHWGIDGQPNDWMTRTGATAMLCGLQIAVPWFLVGVTSLASRLPYSMINIPNREYWLHPDRSSETLAWMNRMLAWIAVLTSILMINLGHMAFIANKTGTELNMGAFAATLGAYLACVFLIAGFSLYRFRMPQSQV